MSRIPLLLAALWLLGGCSSTVRLMPTPTLFTSGDPGLLEAGADVGQDTTIEILYATNRLPVGPPDARHYAGIQSNQLRLGVATLQVGDGTKTREALRTMSTSVVEGERPKITLQATREIAVLDDGDAGARAGRTRRSSPRSTSCCGAAATGTCWSTCTAPTPTSNARPPRPPSSSISWGATPW